MTMAARLAPLLHRPPRPSPSPSYSSPRPKHLSHYQRHLLHTSRPSLADFPDHYATLSIPPTATGPDIKRSFYALSKTHHPDRTRSLPASEADSHRSKYLAISEAYDTLGDPSKREKYDRDRAQRLGHSSAPQSSPDSGFAGGRRASGLSRRRSAFRGPPPSFYRSGGWGTGERARKRREHHEAGEAGARAGTEEQTYARRGASASQKDAKGGGEGWPFAADPNDVPHFDRGAHYRTTVSVEEQLRQGRQRRRHALFGRRGEGHESAWGEGGGGFPEEVGAGKEMRNFGVIVTVFVLGLGLPWLAWGAVSSANGKGKRTKQ